MGIRRSTALEMLLVIALVGSVTSVALPQYLYSLQRARSIQCLTKRQAIEHAELQFASEHNRPSQSLSDLVTSGYLPKEYSCPEKGEFLWITADPDDPSYPKLGCSIHFWQAPTPSGPSLLFSHDFDSMENLTPLKGKWGIENGNLVTKKKGKHLLVFGDASWKDYEVQVTATLAKGKGYGVYYRVDGEKKIDGYLFQYDPGKNPDSFLVRNVINGKEKKPFQQVKMPGDFPVYNQSHEISIQVTGNHHVIKVDGEKVLDFNDNTFTQGMAGLKKWDKSDVSFSSSAVYKAGES